MAQEVDRNAVQERLKELFPSCATDCTEGCKYGCLGWLHRFDPDPGDDDNSEARRTSVDTPRASEGVRGR